MSHLFFSTEELAAMRRRYDGGGPDFREEYLFQDAPASLIDETGARLHRVIRYDGNRFAPVVTHDAKFASWIVTECSVAYALGGDRRFLDAAMKWVAAMADAPSWEKENPKDPDFRFDLNYGNISYCCAFFLDLCGSDCPEEFREKLIAKMLEQMRLADTRFLRRPITSHSFSQNHFYIPFVGYLSLCLALRSRDPGAEARLEAASEFIRPIFGELGEDGWYYEGLNYFHYAFIWLVRLAVLAERHLNISCADYPCFTRLHHFLYWSLFPKGREFFHIGDNSPKQWSFGSWREAVSQPEGRAGNDTHLQNFSHILSWIDGKHPDPQRRAVAAGLESRRFRHPENFWKLLWEQPEEKAAGPVPESWHLFDDFGVWCCDRRNARNDVLRLVAKCGPPLGRSLKLDEAMRPVSSYNAGHVHPDAGSVFAAWNDLPILLGPGYLGRKAGTCLNTVTVDGVGQQEDRLYHALNPETADYGKLLGLSIRGDGDGAVMDFTAAYRPETGVGKAVRVVRARDSGVFDVEDEIELTVPGRIEARFRVSDPPELVNPACVEWRTGGVKMRFEILGGAGEDRIWIAPGEVVTINDSAPGPLESGMTCPRGYQIIVASRTGVLRRCRRFRFSVVEGD